VAHLLLLNILWLLAAVAEVKVLAVVQVVAVALGVF
jgi:hypothetical protein